MPLSYDSFAKLESSYLPLQLQKSPLALMVLAREGEELRQPGSSDRESLTSMSCRSEVSGSIVRGTVIHPTPFHPQSPAILWRKQAP